MRKLLSYLTELSWTMGGVGLVLITLSGQTLQWGIWISVASLAAYIVGAIAEEVGDK